jgi:hypothetical protein
VPNGDGGDSLWCGERCAKGGLRCPEGGKRYAVTLEGIPCRRGNPRDVRVRRYLAVGGVVQRYQDVRASCKAYKKKVGMVHPQNIKEDGGAVDGDPECKKKCLDREA